MAGTRKGRQNINTLLVILIGFCILAIIEIVYGQAQMKVERDRLVLEEQNRQTVEELKEEWRKLQDGTSVVTAQEEPAPVGSSQDQQEQPAKVVEQKQTQKQDDQKGTKAQEDDNRRYDMQ
ncbi:MAG: hypothetical protein K2N37_00985, partial [Lachnospiraceae bacterium]|nr:hypothetical protein [Lachnospiraceae bacterium]